jgi:hypothetical protein
VVGRPWKVVAICVTLVLAGCATPGEGVISGGVGQDTPSPAPTLSPSLIPSDTHTTTPSPSQPIYTVPAKACRVLSAATKRKARLSVMEAKDKLGRRCEWSNDPGPRGAYRPRSVVVHYDPGFSSDVSFTKRQYKESLAEDFRQPSVFSRGPKERFIVKQVGTSVAGRDFDEAYYVYYVDRIAASEHGQGMLVIRKGNVVVTVNAGGADNFGTRVVDGKPISSKTAQKLLDTTADEIIRAIKPSP